MPLDTRPDWWFHPFVATPRSHYRILLNLLLAAALLRLIGLGVHALWLDEGATWSWAVRPSWGGTIFAEANHPPAWWIVTRLWIEAFGDSEAALRAPASILGIATIPLAWLLARRLLDPDYRPRRGGFDRMPDDGRGGRIALWFAGFVALSTYFTEYSQEARMYAALIVEALGLSLLYLRWLDRNDRLSLVGYALLAALALYTQYFAIWIIAGHGGHALWLWRRGRKHDAPFEIRPFVLACVGAGLLFAPWLIFMLKNYEGISTGRPFEPFSRLFYVLWRIGVGPALVVVDRLRQEAGVGSVLKEEGVIAGVTGLLWFAPLIVGILRLRRHPGLASFIVANLALPIVLLLLIFPFFPLIHERYLVFLAPWPVLLAVLGAFESRGAVKIALVSGLALLLGLGGFAFHTVIVRLEPLEVNQALGELRVPRAYDPWRGDVAWPLHHGHPFGKEPWRQARAFIHDHAGTEDLVILHPPYLDLVWNYYDRGTYDLATLPRETLDPAATEQHLGDVLDHRSRIFLVLAHEETEDPDHYYNVLRDILGPRWIRTGRFQAVKPILFNRSWGVRVAVFNRR
jgi:4-amino-4-deoxy-L-arabinose transferase-like glycosyltransferase